MSLPLAVRRALAARERLSRRTVVSIAASLGALSERWLDSSDPYRRRAVRLLTERHGYAAPAAETLLDRLFGSMRETDFVRMLELELGDPRVLDGFRRVRPGDRRLLRAHGPGLITHYLAGNLPNPSIQAVAFGLLLKSANLIKESRRDSGVVGVYLESLRRLDRGLADACVLLDPSDRGAAMEAAGRSGLVTITGQDRTVRHLRSRLESRTKVVGYGHRVSVTVIFKEKLSTVTAVRWLAARTSRDVWEAEQRGCLSCWLVAVERGGGCEPRRFARELSACLDRQDRLDPTSFRSRAGERAKASHRGLWRIRRVKGQDVECLESSPPGRWQVLYEGRESGPPPAGGEWTIRVCAFEGRGWTRAVGRFRGHLQGAALEAPPSRFESCAEALAEMGVSRVTRAGKLQAPPLTWHRDGRPALAEWVRWTDWERTLD